MSLTKATYAMINNAPVNIKDLGAQVNGVADDTPELIIARNQIAQTGGTIIVNGVLAGPGTDLRARAVEFGLGTGTSYATDLDEQHPLVHSYVFNGTPTAGPGFANYGVRYDYQTKPLTDVQSSVGFASIMSSYSTNSLGALLGNNTAQVAGVFNASAMTSTSNANVVGINSIVYSAYSGSETQTIIGMEVNLTATNPAGFFDQAGKAFAVGYSCNLTGSQDGSTGIGIGQSSGLSNGWLHGLLAAGCKYTGMTVARQYVTPDTGLWVSAAQTYGIYVGAKNLYSLSTVNVPSYGPLYNPQIGIALGQRDSSLSESNKLRFVSTDNSAVEHYVDVYSDSSNDIQFSFDGTPKFTIAPNGHVYIQNDQVLSTRQTVTGSRSSGAALASLLTALATHGLITDNTTP